jgi:hypothetical protein
MAVIARYAGWPNLTQDGTGGYIPELFSLKLVTKFYASSVFPEITNTDYADSTQISQVGDRIKLRTIPNVTVTNGEVGQPITWQAEPESNEIELDIGYVAQFAVQIDNIDRFQADIDLQDMYAGDAVRQTVILQDQTLLATVPSEVAAANQGLNAGAISANIDLGAHGSPVVITLSNATEYATYCKQVLDEQNVPFDDGERWFVIPPGYVQRVLNDVLKAANVAGDRESILRNGMTGTLAGFNVFQSNNLSTVTDSYLKVYNILFGHREALAWASQFCNTDLVKLQDYFGYGLRGQCLYGFQAVKPDSFGLLYAAMG